MGNGINIAVVLVTYNRIQDLKKTLNMYSLQKYAPSRLIIVNNASTDGTSEYLKEWSQQETPYIKQIIELKENIGGAGGYYTGMKTALQYDFDFFFIADDDAFPDTNLFNNFVRFCEENKSQLIDQCSAICTSVYDKGKLDISHRRIERKKCFTVESVYVPEDKYKENWFEIDELSFVGSFIKKTSVEKAGLPKKGYFISWDDTEYSLRLKKEGKIIVVPQCRMDHNSSFQTNVVSWRTYYIQRNSIDCYHLHFPRRYYYYKIVHDYLRRTTFLSKLLRNRTKQERQLFKDAIHDAVAGKIDISTKYIPGKKINS